MKATRHVADEKAQEDRAVLLQALRDLLRQGRVERTDRLRKRLGVVARVLVRLGKSVVSGAQA
jgi:hypothetical protein